MGRTDEGASELDGRPRALPVRRHAEILRRVADHGTVAISEVAGTFGVSRETIRRDLRLLADRGELDLVRGGATRFATREQGVEERRSANAAGKSAIARAAADMVCDGMVILLDTGTTTLALAEALAPRRDLVIATAGLAIAQRLCRLRGVRVHLFGGEVDPVEEAVTGIDMLEALAHLRVDLAFIGAGGLSGDGEPTDFTRTGAEQRARMITAATAAWFLIDSDKFERRTPIRIAGAGRAAGLIVDRKPPASMAQAIAARGQEIIVTM